MQISNQEAESLIRQGIDALRQQRAGEARRCFEAVAQTGRANVQVWLLLATSCRADEDPIAEEAALDRLIAQEPRVTRANIMKADCRARAGDDRTALSFYKSALLLANGQQIPHDLLAELQRVEAMVGQLEARFVDEVDAALTKRGFPPGMRSPRFQHSLDLTAGRKEIFPQKPTAYYFPELPQIQFFDPATFEWAAGVESATTAIRDELRGLLAAGTNDFRPYIRSEANKPRIDGNPLLDSVDWSARFLCENGREDEDAVARCPKTWEAIQTASLPRINNSPTIMFSLLRAGARITPHTGMFNTRLTCHLPLIVPLNCGLRVGNEVREWQEGKLLIFDDTIEHEAWNESREDRVVLIFDIWRPELSVQERREIAALFSSSGNE